MFKARGTRVVVEGGPPPKGEPDLGAVTELVHEIPASSPIAVPEPVEAAPEPFDADLAAIMGMGMPELPPDFRDRLFAAQAGDLEAIQLMRAIGERVPADLQMAFAEMVHDMLEAG